MGTLLGCAARAPTCLQSQLQVHQQWAMSYFFSPPLNSLALEQRAIKPHLSKGALCCLPQAILPPSRRAPGFSSRACVSYRKPSAVSLLHETKAEAVTPKADLK